jgi:nucleoid-associated protein YgaU
MRKAITAVTAAGGIAAVALATAGSATAATDAQWNKLAQCESGGNWSIDTGNGYYGGLQFSRSTWLAYGGGAFAPTANKASREQQISIAAKVAVGQGWGAWGCAGRAGITGAAPTAPDADSRGGDQVSRSSNRKSLATNTAKGGSVGRGKHVVRPGETLSSIAAANRIGGGWHQLFAANRSVLKSPNALQVGQVLTLA